MSPLNQPEPIKSFTVEAANRMLPLLRMIVEDAVRQHREVALLQERLKRLKRGRGLESKRTATYYTDEVSEFESELDDQISRYQEYVTELDRLGVRLADADQGLVDFPTRMEGRPCWLSWKPDEEEVGYWREYESQPDDRHSLLAGANFPGSPQSPPSSGKKPSALG